MTVQRILNLAEEFFRLARDRVPQIFLNTELTMRQLKVLYTLYIDGPQTCGALAAAQHLSLPTMTGILSRLEAAGYLERQRDSEDARRVISDLSPQGRDLVDQLWASGLGELEEVLRGVPKEDLRTVERALEVLNDALRASSEPLQPEEVAPHHDA